MNNEPRPTLIVSKIRIVLLVSITFSCSYPVQAADTMPETNSDVLDAISKRAIDHVIELLDTPPIHIGVFQLPSFIEDYDRKPDYTDYEKDEPGLGYSIGYNRLGCKSTVYLYTLGRDHIGPSDIEVTLAQAVEEVYRYYKKVEIVEVMEYNHEALGLTVQSVQFTYDEDYVPKTSYLFLTSMCDQFVKIRATCDNDHLKDGDPTQFSFSLIESLISTANCH